MVDHVNAGAREEDICFFCLEGETINQDGSTSSLLDHQNLFPCECTVKVHSQCINTWLGYKDCCPVCKTAVVREEQEPNRSTDDIARIIQSHYAPTTSIHLLRPPAPPRPLLSPCERMFIILVIASILVLFVFPGLNRLGINL